VGDPLTDTNFRSYSEAPFDASLWTGENITYRKVFPWPAAVTEATTVEMREASDYRVAANMRPTLLVFEGIKMGASIALNGMSLGNTTNQHRRYLFDVGSLLKPVDNELTITFRRDIANGGRFMDCSGGWDWVRRDLPVPPHHVPRPPHICSTMPGPTSYLQHNARSHLIPAAQRPVPPHTRSTTPGPTSYPQHNMPMDWLSLMLLLCIALCRRPTAVLGTLRGTQCSPAASGKAFIW